MKVRKTPVVNKEKKSQIAADSNNPYATKGNPRPKTRLSESEMATPRYCPKNMELRLMGCAKRSSVNSFEL